MPSAVRAGSDVLLFSNLTVLWRNEKVFADTAGMIDEAKAGTYIDTDTLAGAILDARGLATTFGKPKGFKQMTAMVAASDGHEGAWATWLTAPDSIRAPYDLWAGHYQRGKWEQVEHLMKAAYISKYSLSISAAGKNSSPLISLVGDDGTNDGKSRGVGVFRRDGEHWKASWAFTGDFLPLAAQLGRLTDDRVVIAYLGEFRRMPVRVDSNAIWVAQSSDGGRTWSNFTSIGVNWNYRANWLDLQVADSNNVHLLYMKDHTGDTSAMLVHIVSQDGGVTWRSAHTTTHRPLKSLTSTATRAGLTFIARDVLDSLALVELRTYEAPAVQHVSWQGRTLPTRASTLGDNSGPVLVIWGSLISNAYPLFPGFPVPASSFAWMRPCAR